MLKTYTLITRIITIIGIAAIVFSCNNNANKSGSSKTDSTKSSADNSLLYLDTARDMYNILSQGWVMAEDADGLEGMEENSKFEIPYRSIYFANNGSFVKDPRNEFDHGTWSFDEAAKTISVNSNAGKGNQKYKIARVSPDDLVLVPAGSTENLKFISQGMRFKNPADDPFYIENNRWRIKPKAKETDSAIHQRLKENLHFFILFYKAVIAKNDRQVSFWGLPSCYKWYGGGIFLKKENELKANWINCFYNKEQAMQAYDIADRLLSKKYTWPKGERNWLKLNLAVLEQMYGKMDEVR